MTARMPYAYRLLAFVALASVVIPPPAGAGPLVESLAIRLSGRSREFAYTNKVSAFYYGETSGPNRSSWQGFNVLGHEFLDDYQILINGTPLSRESARSVTVYPDHLVRHYPGNITEELRFVDSLAMFAVRLTGPAPFEAGVVPLFTDARDSAAFLPVLSAGTVLLAHRAHLHRSAEANYPVWLVVHGRTALPALRPARHGSRFSPVRLYAPRQKRHEFVFAVADDSLEARRLSAMFDTQSETLFAARRARMERLLTASRTETGDARFDSALAWAKISLDALVMNQGRRGIFAGLPWFNNYWGRDTFIALPGAALVTGQLTTAKEILRSFAAYQQTDTASADYGRIPNLVTTTDKAFNTADGTPRFVAMAREYVERAGDSAFIVEIYPTILRSIEGTLRYHADSLGFLTHGDAETWMDAVGPEGPWSPRGNRANDIQALWHAQLEAGVWFATRLGDATSAHRWNEQRKRVAEHFASSFVAGGRVADRLTPEGSPDWKLRPNQIFTLALLDEATRVRVIRIVTDSLTYAYGVASLSQDDPDFHPYHQFPPYYPKDAAYHNGTVWTWLQGALISALCRYGRQDLAVELSDNSAHQILDRGAVGTQSELLDAIPRPGESEPRLSGTFSQAWNLAEFVRNFYDDYLGLRVDEYTRTITLHPHLPASFGAVHARIPLARGSCEVLVSPGPARRSVTLKLSSAATLRTTVELEDSSGKIIQLSRLLTAGTPATFIATTGDPATPAPGSRASLSAPRIPGPLSFALPALRPGLKALQGPGYPELTYGQIKAANPGAGLLCDADDPAGDDIGTGRYRYPLNSAFVPGAFDIVKLRITADSANAYIELRFRALSDPGWHPEYGFQLTYAAIAVDQDGIPGSGAQDVPWNARYRLPPQDAYERLILIGGGIRIEDDRGTPLAVYTPTESDAGNPFGNADEGTVRFTVPLKYLGKPSGAWTFTVLAGAQDDHGGAGIGEFRSVNKDPGEWNGGGKARPEDPNIYDVLVARGKH